MSGTRQWFEEDAKRQDDMRKRIMALSTEVSTLKSVLTMALEESPHPPDCGIQKHQDCSCWRYEARRLLGK